MSLSYTKLNLVKVFDPAMNVDEHKSYAIIRGSQSVVYYQSTAQNTTTGNIQFVLAINSPQTVIDRKLFLTYYLDIVTDGDMQLGSYNGDGLRQYPISACCTNMQASINSEQVSVDLSDIVHPLMRYKADPIDLSNELSLSGSKRDLFQAYGDAAIYGTAASPLSAYGATEAMYGESRSQFPMQVLSARHVRVIVTEPFHLLDPFVSKGDHVGFCGLKNLTFNIVNSNGLSRVWSSGNPNINNVTVTFYSPPVISYRQLNLLDSQVAPKVISYPFNKYVRYSTDVGTLAPGASTTFSTMAQQLSQIPHSIYFYVRRQNADQTFKTSDVFAGITNINITLGNINGLLSNATQWNLHNMCVKNSLRDGWSEFSKYGGSVIRCKVGYDLPTTSMTAPGMSAMLNLQAQITCTNLNSTESIAFTCFMVTEVEGVFSLIDGSARINLGPVSPDDVIKSLPVLPGNVVTANSYAGGSFFSDVWSGIKSVASKALPIAQQVAVPLLKSRLGLGMKKKSKRGGALLSEKELRKRLGSDSKDSGSEEDD